MQSRITDEKTKTTQERRGKTSWLNSVDDPLEPVESVMSA